MNDPASTQAKREKTEQMKAEKLDTQDMLSTMKQARGCVALGIAHNDRDSMRMAYNLLDEAIKNEERNNRY